MLVNPIFQLLFPLFAFMNLGYNVGTDVPTYKNASHFPLNGFIWLVRVNLGYNIIYK